MVLQDTVSSGSAEVSKSTLQALEAKAQKHFRQGITVEDRLSVFLRLDQVHSLRRTLEAYLEVMSMGASFPETDSFETEAFTTKRECEPHDATQSSLLATTWRNAAANYANMMKGAGGNTMYHATTLAPPRTSTVGATSRSAVPATIDELFSALKAPLRVSWCCRRCSLELVSCRCRGFTARTSARYGVQCHTGVAKPIPSQALTLLNHWR